MSEQSADDARVLGRSDDGAKVSRQSVDAATDIPHWIFQGLPEQYDLKTELQVGKTENWQVNQYRKEIKAGDFVWFWRARDRKSKEERAIYGIGIITSDPSRDSKSRKWRAPVEYRERFDPPLSLGIIKNVPALHNLRILRYAQGTNFPVSPKEAQALVNLKDRRTKTPEVFGDLEESDFSPACWMLLRTAAAIVSNALSASKDDDKSLRPVDIVGSAIAIGKSEPPDELKTTRWLVDWIEGFPNGLLGTMEAYPAYVTADPNPNLKLAPEILPALDIARELAKRTIQQSHISLRHLFLGLLIANNGRPVEGLNKDASQFVTIDLAQFIPYLLERVAEHLLPGENIDTLQRAARDPVAFVRELRGLAATYNSTLVTDNPEDEQDFLGRTDLAFMLAARLNWIWNSENKKPAKGAPGFVVHVDAPWGGGKTTFANFVSLILNPYRLKGDLPQWLKEMSLTDAEYWPEEFRRPWHIVTYNAWQHQHVDPPWWCFYEAIRRQCFNSVRSEYWTANQVSALPPPERQFKFKNTLTRYCDWTFLWTHELLWRFFNPKINKLLGVFSISILIAAAAFWMGWIKFESNKLIPTFDGWPGYVFGITSLLAGGLSFVWTAFSTLTESLLAGTPSAAKNYSLGSGDPIERFRRHFESIIRRVRRPVLVIVDDIDRCPPNVIVELLRGIQSILRSPRVVFVILGDRDWIELAFANHHEAMKNINVGNEHTFGGRFVEKVIQLSLALPPINDSYRTEFVSAILNVAEKISVPDALKQAAEYNSNSSRQMGEVKNTRDPAAREKKFESIREQAKQGGANDEQIQSLNRKMAQLDAVDAQSELRTQHRLAAFAPVLPPNPRQIKRIINTVSLYQNVGRIQRDIQPETEGWCKLALWIVLMIEWPITWNTIAHYPDLLLALDSPKIKRQKNGATGLNGTLDDATWTKWVADISTNAAFMAVLNFSKRKDVEGQDTPWANANIGPEDVVNFRDIVPPWDGALLERPEKKQN